MFPHTADPFRTAYRFRDLGVQMSTLILGARESSLCFGCLYMVGALDTGFVGRLVGLMEALHQNNFG